MNDIELVQRVIALYRVMHWTQGCNAENSTQRMLKPTDPRATALCLRGACLRVLEPDANLLATEFTFESGLSEQIARALGFESNAAVVAWNDAQDRTFEDVIALLDARLLLIPIEEAAREEERQREKEEPPKPKIKMQPRHTIKKREDENND